MNERDLRVLIKIVELTAENAYQRGFNDAKEKRPEETNFTMGKASILALRKEVNLMLKKS